jgi:ABC-type dipeptide/oligopeptide/nickel transport system permease component
MEHIIALLIFFLQAIGYFVMGLLFFLFIFAVLTRWFATDMGKKIEEAESEEICDKDNNLN